MQRVVPLAGLANRVIRWARTPSTVGGQRRRFIIIQIDGLSHSSLRRALARGYRPGVAGLVSRGTSLSRRAGRAQPASGHRFYSGARSGGPICYFRGILIRIPPAPEQTGCPLFDRPDCALVVQGLTDPLSMRNSGDIVIYGIYADAGCVSYLGEQGSHAGPSEDELYGFILASSASAFDFGAVRGPRDLFPWFIQYQGVFEPIRKNHD
jgi:hypothetical protein